MKKIFTLLSIICAFVFMVACSSSQSTPTAVAESYAKAMQKADFEAVLDLVYLGADATKATEKKAQYLAILSEKGKAQIESKGGITSYTIGEAEISEDGTSAEVRVDLTYGNGKTEGSNQDFVCVDGTWYLADGK